MSEGAAAVVVSPGFEYMSSVPEPPQNSYDLVSFTKLICRKTPTEEFPVQLYLLSVQDSPDSVIT